MTDFQIVQLDPRPAAVKRGVVPMDELPAFFGSAFGEVAAVLAAQGVELRGEPFGYYPAAPTDHVEVAAGFPTDRAVEPAGDVVAMVLPGGPAVTGVHVGPYETMQETYGELLGWMAEHGLEPAGYMWEYYLSDPAAEPDPATWRTAIVWPVRPSSERTGG